MHMQTITTEFLAYTKSKILLNIYLKRRIIIINKPELIQNCAFSENAICIQICLCCQATYDYQYILYKFCTVLSLDIGSSQERHQFFAGTYQ
jgi:hypothetical protein